MPSSHSIALWHFIKLNANIYIPLDRIKMSIGLKWNVTYTICWLWLLSLSFLVSSSFLFYPSWDWYGDDIDEFNAQVATVFDTEKPSRYQLSTYFHFSLKEIIPFGLISQKTFALQHFQIHLHSHRIAKDKSADQTKTDLKILMLEKCKEILEKSLSFYKTN